MCPDRHYTSYNLSPGVANIITCGVVAEHMKGSYNVPVPYYVVVVL